jgi:branched-chain amino acid transport system ATP-binding protein
MLRKALTVTGLKKSYGGLYATRDVHLDVTAGDVHAVIGPNGAGKTTLLSLLAGALQSDAGEIYLFDAPVHPLSEQKRVAVGLVRSFQITSVFDEMTVVDNLIVAVHKKMYSDYGFFRSGTSDEHAKEVAMALAQRVGLGDFALRPCTQLSHGARRRLDVGLAIACEPKLLLMDEPMAGMGHEESQDMIALIQSLKKDMTIVLVEHDMDAVFALADKITVLVQGAVLVTGTVDEIKSNQEVKLAYLGEDEETSEVAA